MPMAAAGQVPKLKLRVKDERPLSGLAAAQSIAGPVKCDPQGNIYLRPSAPFQQAFTEPIVKISRDGEQKAVFKFDSIPGFEGGPVEASDFAIGWRGQVNLVARRCKGEKTRRCEVDLVTFGEDGAYQSATKLERYLSPSQLELFTTGDFLVAGLTLEQPLAPDASLAEKARVANIPRRPLTLVFDGTGRVRAELGLPSDVSPIGAHGTGGEKAARDAQLEVELGMVASGEDGYVYLMRRTAKPVVYAVSAAGSVARHIQLQPPVEGMWPTALKLATGGRLVVEFASRIGDTGFDTGRAVYSLVDAETGEGVVDYESSPGVGGVFACYSANEFTFLGGTKEGGHVIRHAVPH